MTTATTDIDAVASVLTEAFTDDPVMKWVFADALKRGESLQTWWRFMLNRRPKGSLMMVCEDQATAAFWHAPKFDTEAPQQAARAASPSDGETPGGEVQDPFIALMTDLVGRRLSEVLSYFGQVVEAHPTEPHWYLSAIGTRLAAQGQGGGHRLLQPMLDRCDAEGLPAYLESSNLRNVPFYFRHGFVSVGDLSTPDGSALMTFMRREPR